MLRKLGYAACMWTVDTGYERACAPAPARSHTAQPPQRTASLTHRAALEDRPGAALPSCDWSGFVALQNLVSDRKDAR